MNGMYTRGEAVGRRIVFHTVGRKRWLESPGVWAGNLQTATELDLKPASKEFLSGPWRTKKDARTMAGLKNERP